jgi:hypothetical protein
MAIRPLILLIALSAIFLPAFAQPGMEKISPPSSATDLGVIGKEKINHSYDESFKHPGDMNWFKFAVTSPQDVFLAVAEKEIYHGIIVYDNDMRYVNAGELMLPLRLEPGTYYARIEAYPYKIRDYQALNNALNYTLLVGNTFEKESNDGLLEANYLGSPAKPVMIAGKIDPANDLDFFKFDVPDKYIGHLDISIITTSLLNDYIDTVIYKYNKSEDRYIPGTESSQILKSGSYFVRLEKPSDVDEYLKDYVLYLNLSQMATKSLWSLNKSVPLNESGKIIESDVDTYEFDVPESMNVTIETSGENGDSKICLYDSNLEEVECNDDYMGSLWSRIERNLPQDKYYVEVRSFGSGLSYNITVSGS